MADYLEAYAEALRPPGPDRRHRGMPRSASASTRRGDRRVTSGSRPTTSWWPWASFQGSVDPGVRRRLDPRIVQLHAEPVPEPVAAAARGGVLVVGTGNSGAEIAVEVVAGRRTTYLAGDAHNGQLPFRADSLVGAGRVLLPLQFRVIGHHLAHRATPRSGRRVRPQLLAHAAPLVRIGRDDLAAAGWSGFRGSRGGTRGAAVLADGRTIDVASVIWCTGYRPDFSWIELPVVDEGGEGSRATTAGIVGEEPGLYFVGLFFLYAMSSGFLPGVGRDADHIATHIAARVHDARPPSP